MVGAAPDLQPTIGADEFVVIPAVGDGPVDVCRLEMTASPGTSRGPERCSCSTWTI